MPTIIDSLCVTLGLDTSKFTEGQRQVDQSLRSLESGAERTGAGFRDIGVDVLAFLKLLEAPSRTIRRHLETLAAPALTAQRQLAGVGAQARRTSAAGEAGLAGLTAGVRALGIAGLVAVGIFETMKKTIEAATVSAKDVFNVGVGAQASGLPVQEFSAISQALLKHGNVPEQETQDWLVGIKQFQEDLKRGVVGPQMLAFGKIGINPTTATPEQLLEQLALKFAGESDPAQVVNQGRSVGLSALASEKLREAGQRLPGYIAEARKTATTQKQLDQDEKLLDAENRLSIAWGNLSRQILLDVDPGLITVIDKLTSFVKSLGSLDDILTKLNKSAGGLGDADTNDLFVLLKTLGDLLNSNWSAVPGDLGKLSDFHYGAPGGTKPGELPAPAKDLASDPAFAGMSPADIATMSAIRQRESGGDYKAVNRKNSAGDLVPESQWHRGAWQFGDSTWRDAASAIGASQYAHADDAPAAVQNAAAAWLKSKRGFAPWAASGPWPNVAGKAPSAPSKPRAAAPTMGPDGLPKLDLPTISLPPGITGMLQGAQRGALAMNGGNVTNSNDNSRTASATVGQIVVNTRATDGPGVVRAIREAVNRNLLVGQANTGLS